MLRLPAPARRLGWSLTFGLAGSAGFLALLPAMGDFWTVLFEQGHRLLGLPGAVERRGFAVLDGIEFAIPTLALEGTVPTDSTLGITAAITALLIAISLLFRDRWIPLAYFLRAVAIVQLTSVAYFAWFGAAFPYRLPEYVVGLLTAGLFLMGLVPLLLGLTFYFLDVSPIRKVGLTVAVLGHLALLLPLQAMLHASLITVLTIVVMPLLFLLFGFLLDVMVLVAFYGWAMSWPSSLFREAAPR